MTTENTTASKPAVDLSAVMACAKALATAAKNHVAAMLQPYVEGFQAFATATGKSVKDASTVNAFHAVIKDTVMKETGWKENTTRKQFSVWRTLAKLPGMPSKGKGKKGKASKNKSETISLTLASETTKVKLSDILDNETEGRDNLFDVFVGLASNEKYGKTVQEVMMEVLEAIEKRSK
jgi:hypothetical protein